MIRRFSPHWLSILLLAGCAGDPTAAVDAGATSRPVPAERLDAAARAMQPMLGVWLTDVDATVEANRAIGDERLGELMRGLQASPYTLEISKDRYVSRSRTLTRADHYTAIGYDDEEGVVIALEAVNGEESPIDRRGQQRSARLLIRGGRLFIGPNEGVTIVFSRRR